MSVQTNLNPNAAAFNPMPQNNVEEPKMELYYLTINAHDRNGTGLTRYIPVKVRSDIPPEIASELAYQEYMKSQCQSHQMFYEQYAYQQPYAQQHLTYPSDYPLQYFIIQPTMPTSPPIIANVQSPQYSPPQSPEVPGQNYFVVQQPTIQTSPIVSTSPVLHAMPETPQYYAAPPMIHNPPPVSNDQQILQSPEIAGNQYYIVPPTMSNYQYPHQQKRFNGSYREENGRFNKSNGERLYNRSRMHKNSPRNNRQDQNGNGYYSQRHWQNNGNRQHSFGNGNRGGWNGNRNYHNNNELMRFDNSSFYIENNRRDNLNDFNNNKNQRNDSFGSYDQQCEQSWYCDDDVVQYNTQNSMESDEELSTQNHIDPHQVNHEIVSQDNRQQKLQEFNNRLKPLNSQIFINNHHNGRELNKSKIPTPIHKPVRKLSKSPEITFMDRINEDPEPDQIHAC